MNLHQFRFIQEAVRRGLNLTETAKALHTSQPGISKAILDLEDELGFDIFVRHGKRLRKVTEPGQQVLAAVEIILREVDNLRRIGDEYRLQDAGSLVVAATAGAAHFILPEALAQLRRRHPRVRVRVVEGDAEQTLNRLRDDTADLALLSETLASPDVAELPFAAWQPMLVMPHGHPLASADALTLEQVIGEPLLTDTPRMGCRALLERACAPRGLKPQLALESADSGRILRYVEQGMSVGLVSDLALRMPAGGNGTLVSRSLSALLGEGEMLVAVKRGVYLRNVVFALAESLSERLTRAAISQALAIPPRD